MSLRQAAGRRCLTVLAAALWTGGCAAPGASGTGGQAVGSLHLYGLPVALDLDGRPGPDGIASDLIAMWLPWEFRLAAIRVPTTVFHAALDAHNEADAQTYAAEIPNARLVVWPAAGHLGILAHWPEVLDALGHE